MAMELVSTVTVGSGGATEIEWTAIPATGKDLLVVASIRVSDATIDQALSITINSDTTNANYSRRRLAGDGSAATSTSFAGRPVLLATGASATASTFGNGAIYISNYAGSATKTLSIDTVTENNATTSYQHIEAGFWNNTSAITSVRLSGGTSFVQHSTASLYIIS